MVIRLASTATKPNTARFFVHRALPCSSAMLTASMGCFAGRIDHRRFVSTNFVQNNANANTNSIVHVSSATRVARTHESLITSYVRTLSSTTTSPGSSNGSVGGRCQCPKCGGLLYYRRGKWGDSPYFCTACKEWVYPDSAEASPPIRSELRPSQCGSQPDYHNTGDQPNHQSVDNTEITKQQTPPPRPPQHAHHHFPTPVKTTVSQEYDEIGVVQQPRQQPTQWGQIPTPKEIAKGLDEYVIGQTHVKVALSVGIYNHYKRILTSEKKNGQEEKQSIDEDSGSRPRRTTRKKVTSRKADQQQNVGDGDDVSKTLGGPVPVEIDKSNILLLGPTGSGKTFLVKTLARLIDVPIVIADATCLTQAGYAGEDVESILVKLYMESGQDLERCQRGIIYIDEIDKIRATSGKNAYRDVSGEGVQHALLKIVEGNVINVPTSPSSKDAGSRRNRGDTLQIDTTNILFICGGAYAGLERIINRRLDAASIGFGAPMKKAIDDPTVQGRYFEHAIPKDLVMYGMIPEFVGRFPVIVATNGLDIPHLVDILTKPKNSIVKQYRHLFDMDDLDFHITQDGLEELAKVAFSRGTGARGLRSITENVLMDTQFMVPSMPDVHTVYLDAAAVRGERKPILLEDPSMTIDNFEDLMEQGKLEVAPDGTVSFKEGVEASVPRVFA